MSFTKNSGRIADLIIFSQREFILGLSKDLGHMRISFCQFYLLCALTSEKDVVMSQVAKKVGICNAAATGLVDYLEKYGFVRREQNKNDARSVLVNITEKGRNFVSDLRLRIQNRVAEAIEMDDNPIHHLLNGDDL